MKICSMHLENYRCFKNFRIAFDDQLTVLVGANGAGKTAVLDALGAFFDWTNQNYLTYNLTVTDVLIGEKPQNVTCNYELSSKNSLNDDPLQICFAYSNSSKNITFKPISPKSKGDVKGLLAKSEPVIVSYMSMRSISEHDFVLKQNISTRHNNSTHRMIDYASTLEWFNNIDADEARDMRDNKHKKELPELKAVRDALSLALGQYEKPRMDGNPPELIIKKRGTDLYFKVSQLSDGYRAMLALVMDLSRRMAQSHGGGNDLKSPLHAPAIVLIDEVELHLHPTWQQTVLTTLMEIFPNTQFIVTTHSSQILTSVDSKHIRILSDGNTYTVEQQTQGAEVSRVLEDIFGTKLRPGNLEIVKALNDYADLVYREEWDTQKANELKEKLFAHYGNAEPVLDDLQLHIDNTLWERGL